MNHLHKFNESKSINFTIVDFTGGGDGVHALYIDDVLYKYGDYYHDKMEIWIEAFIEGVEWSKINITVSKVKCKNEEIIEEISSLGGIPPKKLTEHIIDGD